MAKREKTPHLYEGAIYSRLNSNKTPDSNSLMYNKKVRSTTYRGAAQKMATRCWREDQNPQFLKGGVFLEVARYSETNGQAQNKLLSSYLYNVVIEPVNQVIEKKKNNDSIDLVQINYKYRAKPRRIWRPSERVIQPPIRVDGNNNMESSLSDEE